MLLGVTPPSCASNGTSEARPIFEVELGSALVHTSSGAFSDGTAFSNFTALEAATVHALDPLRQSETKRNDTMIRQNAKRDATQKNQQTPRSVKGHRRTTKTTNQEKTAHGRSRSSRALETTTDDTPL